MSDVAISKLQINSLRCSLPLILSPPGGGNAVGSFSNDVSLPLKSQLLFLKYGTLSANTLVEVLTNLTVTISLLIGPLCKHVHSF